MKRLTFSLILSLSILAGNIAAYAQGAKCDPQDYGCQTKEILARIQKNPKDIEAYYDIGIVYQKSGFHKEAVEMFSMYLTVGVDNPRHMADGYNNRGISQKNLGKYDLAVEDYTKAIGLAPTDASIYVNRANAYREMKDYDKAIAEYTRAADVDPKHAQAYIGRGHIYHAFKKDPARALADYNKAIEIDPNESEAYYNRATLSYEAKEFAKAIPDYDKYISLNQASPVGISDGYLNRGICHAIGGNMDKALADFTKAIELNPKQANAYKARAYAYRQMNKPALADADEKKAAELSGVK
jgi:tetratricopeptide (TPR) repeat protein